MIPPGAGSGRPTKRYVSRSALLTSLLGLAILAGTGYLWHDFSLRRNAKALYNYAEQCAEQKDYAAAAAQFDRYVQFCPNDAAARVRLAETYDLAYSKLRRAQRAIELYHEALGVAAEEQKASIHGRLGELLLQIRQYAAAANEAAAMLEQDPKNARAMTVQAKALYGQARLGTFPGKPGEVGASFETALAHDPGERDTAVTLARIYRDEPQYLSEAAHARGVAEREKAADQIIDRLVAAHPDRPDAHLARYQYRLQYRLPGADDDLKEARRLGRENPDVLLASAEAFRREALDVAPSAAADGDPGTVPAKATVPARARWLREAARANYEKVVAVAAHDYRGYFGLGETLWELGQSQAAIDAWKRSLESAPAATSLFDILLASGLVKMGRFDEAEKHLDRLAKAFEKRDARQVPYEKGLSVRKYQLIRARWLRGKNQPFQAIALAHGVATGTTATAEEVNIALEGWSLLADTCVWLGRWAEAAEAFEKAVEMAPKSPRNRAMAAAAWMAANQPDRAVRALRLALAFGDGAEPRLALATAIFRQNVMAHQGQPRLAGGARRLGRRPPGPCEAALAGTLAVGAAGSGSGPGPSGCRGSPCGRCPRGGGHLSEHQTG